MSIQSFSVGQVLTAAQVNALQTNDYNQTVSNKTASYTLVATDKGTRIAMNSTSATTITVNTSLFSAGDTLFIQNLNTGVSTITAGTATVTTSASLALAQWEGGTLYFTSASAAIFFKSAGAAAGGGGKVLQVVNGSTTTAVNITTSTATDTGLTATITPTLNTSKILVLVNQTVAVERASGNNTGVRQTLLRGSTVIGGTASSRTLSLGDIVGATGVYFTGIIPYSILDAPATTSATTYKTQGSCPVSAADTVNFQPASIVSSIVLLEIGA